jgi:hypothetical protein
MAIFVRASIALLRHDEKKAVDTLTVKTACDLS